MGLFGAMLLWFGGCIVMVMSPAVAVYITIIWNDVCISIPKFIYFLLPSPSYGVLSFLGFEKLFVIFTSVCMVF